MQAAFNQFSASMVRVRNLRGIFSFLSTQTTNVLDLSDLLRNELVMAVSALDLYIHEVVRLGMLDAHAGNRTRTTTFLRFPITLDSFFQNTSNAVSNVWLENEIRTRHSYQSFQTPDKIAEAIKLISDVPLWNEVGLTLGLPTNDVRRELSLIVDRRNKIAHEADLNPTSFTNELWPIDEMLVDNAVNFIEQVGAAIHSVVV